MTKKKTEIQEPGSSKETAIFVKEFGIFTFENRRAEIVERIIKRKSTFFMKEKEIVKFLGKKQQTINDRINELLDSDTYKNDHNSIYSYYRYIGKNGHNYTFRGFTVTALIYLATGTREFDEASREDKEFCRRLIQHIAEVYGEHVVDGITFDESRVDDPRTVSKGEKIYYLIRCDERNIAKKVDDMLKYMNSEYSPKSKATVNFYATRYDLICYAVTGLTSLEFIEFSADPNKEYMGLVTFKAQKTPEKPLKIVFTDLETAKNFYSEEQLKIAYAIEEVFIQRLAIKMIKNEKLEGKELLKILKECIVFLGLPVLNYVCPLERETFIPTLRPLFEQYEARINGNLEVLNKCLTA